MVEKGDDNRFNNTKSKESPTNYPTYLGTTYFPTLTWPTYSPTSTEDASAATRFPKKKKRNKQAKQQDQLEAAGTTSSSRLILTSSPVITPTSPPSKRPTSPPSKMPTPPPSKRPIITEAPTYNARSPNSSRTWSGSSRGQPYSRRHSSDSTLTKVPTPIPESTDTSERGQPYSRRHSTDPTVSDLEEVRFRELPTGSPTSNAQSPDASPRRSGSSRVQPHSRRHSPVPTVWSGPLKSSEPTPSPSTAAPKGEQTEAANEDEKKKSTKKTESSELIESSDTKTGETKDKTSGSEDKDRDQTAKLNLSFEVKEVPSPSPVKADSTSKLSLKFYGQGEDDDKGKDDAKGNDDDKDASGPTMSPMTEEPTYFIYPTLTPTEVVEMDTRIPPTYMPTTGTYMPTTENPLSFDSRNRVVGYPTSSSPSSLAVDGESASIFDKRICPGYPLGFDPLTPQQEQEVVFAYGIQTNAGESIESSVEKVQLWMLEDVASRLLLCPNDGNSISGRLLKDEKGGQFEQLVSRVYYMEDQSVATLSKCTPTFSNATECAIVQSAIYLTANIGHREEARIDTLSVINDRLRRGSYEQGAILHISYLGPDMNYLNAIRSNNVDSIKNISGSTLPITFYIAIGVVSLAVCALASFLIMVMRVRKERKRASAVLSSPGYQHTPMAVDGMHFSQPPSSKNSPMYFHDSSRTHQ